MDLPGSVQYRGKKIYVNRKTLLQTGRWKWVQEATGLGAEFSPEPTLREFAMRWVEHRQARGLTSAFDDASRFRCRVLPFVVDGVGEFGDLPLRDVRPLPIRAWITEIAAQRLGPRTVRNLYAMVRGMFADAYAEDRVAGNPCRLRCTDLPPSLDRDPRWRVSALFSRDKLVMLTSDSRIPIDRRAFFCAAAFLSASRSGELSGLRVRDYDRTARPLPRLSVSESYSVHLKKTKRTKTGVTRLVPVHPALQRILDEWLTCEDLYITLPWAVFCQEILKLKLPL